jgi:hypothetical protein
MVGQESWANVEISALDAQSSERSKGFTDDKNPTSEELGILASFAGVYNKSREAVKAVYDEIQYWKGIGATFGMMRNWYKEQKDNFQRIGRTAGALFTAPDKVFAGVSGKDWFDKALNYADAPLKVATELFGAIDYTIYQAPKEMDNIFGRAEYYMDKIGDSRFSGAIMPNTEEIYENFNVMILNSDVSDRVKNKFRLKEENKQKNFEEIVKNANDLYKQVGVEEMPEYKIVETIKAMTASATHNSQNYTIWAGETAFRLNEKVSEIDRLFEQDEEGNSKMDNIMDLQILAAMNELEMINANNKKILHQLELLKAHHALLGLEIWKYNKDKTSGEAFTASALIMRVNAESELENLTVYLDKKYNRKKK